MVEKKIIIKAADLAEWKSLYITIIVHRVIMFWEPDAKWKWFTFQLYHYLWKITNHSKITQIHFYLLVSIYLVIE